MSTTKVLNLLAILSAIIAIYCDFNQDFNLFRFFKPLTTIFITLIPLLYRNTFYKKYSQFILIALFFCLIGDIFLLNENDFVYGLASFLLAHILFTIAFVSIDKWKAYPIPLVTVSIIGISYYLFIYENLNGLAVPVLLYFVFIILMCWQGICLYIWRKEFAFKLVAFAVILFPISDSVIALSKFKMQFELSGPVILTTYWLSIALLANSTVAIEKISTK